MKKRTFKNILVISLSNIGDVILTLPVVNVLRGNFPGSKISIVIGPNAVELLTGCKELHEVIVYDKRASLLSKARFVYDLRTHKFDCAVDLRNTAIPYLLLPITCDVLSCVARQHAGSMKKKHLDRLAFLGLDMNVSEPITLYSSNDERSLSDKLSQRGITEKYVGRAVLIAPSARTPFKTWPAEKFVGLCKKIREEYPDRPIMLVGSKDEEGIAITIKEKVAHDVVVLAGALSLKEYAALTQQAALLVAHDSAAMHIGNYHSIPLIALFGPTSAEQYGEDSDTSTVIKRNDLDCVPCCGVQCDIGRVCLSELPVDTVFAEVRRKLSMQP
ncbi:MAG: glycosyltransferase family 9 protein [Candidatus Omnitrophica bacterium]|nr:glycosyltransferase family 9 protein [Candidatus Omnitrophota bacterium]